MNLFLRSPARLLDLVFLVSFALLLCSFAIGAYYSSEKRGQLPSVYDSYFEEGDRLFLQGDCGHAIPIYQIVSAINREDINTYLRLAICYQMTRQKDEAKKSLDRYVKMTLDREEPYFPLGLKSKKKSQKRKGSLLAGAPQPPSGLAAQTDNVGVAPEPSAEEE